MQITSLCASGVTWLKQSLSHARGLIGLRNNLKATRSNNMPKKVVKKVVEAATKVVKKKVEEPAVLTKKQRMAKQQGFAK